MSYEAYDASAAQKRLYLIDRLYENSTLYNMPFGWMMEGNLNPQRLKKAVHKLIQRHETLRTTFAFNDGDVLQIVHEPEDFSDFHIKHTKYSNISDNLTGNEPNHTIERIIDDFVKPFNLEKMPLWRMEQVEISPEKHLVLFDIHHTICDGVSIAVVLDDLMEYYTGGEKPQLDYQYVDYTQWQNEQWESDRIKRQEQFWLKVYETPPPAWEMPVDRPRTQAPDTAGDTVIFFYDNQLTTRLNRQAAENKTTLFVILLAQYTILLSKLSGQEDIVVGSPVSGRTHKEFESIIGMFVNTLAMRNQPTGHLTYRQYLQQVSINTFSAFENQDYPFDMLVEKLLPERHHNRNPLFETMLVLQNFMARRQFTDTESMNNNSGVPVEQPPAENLTCTPYPVKEKTAKFELTLAAMETDGKIQLELLYRTALFENQNMERFTRRMIKLAEDVTKNPDIQLSQLQIIMPDEKSEMLAHFNCIDKGYSTSKTIQGLFYQQVERTPDAVALSGPDQQSQTVALTYRELSRTADRLAYRLMEKGVAPGDIVGIMANRSINMHIGQLGILKAGAAFMPINPKSPPQRVRYLMRDSNAKILVIGNTEWNDEIIIETGAGKTVDVVPVNSKDETLGLDLPVLRLPHSPAQTSYVIYTSGSTGQPKGVPVTQANISQLLHWGYTIFDLGTQDRVVQNLAFYFDWSVWEIFITLTTGASLHSIPDEIQQDPDALIDFIGSRIISVLHITPTHYRYLANAGEKTETLEYLCFGGEKLTKDLVNSALTRVNQRCRIFNMYGPTEATIVAAVEEYRREPEAYDHRLTSIPIGKPPGNTGLQVLDRYLNPCPPNVNGELYITGDCVAPGYLNNPELTAEKFLKPQGSQSTKKLKKHFFSESYETTDSSVSSVPGTYKTGDQVRWYSGGHIDYLDRFDHQVKIRGLRIELGEIENRLHTHPTVKEAVVLDKTAADGEKFLCAYIVPNNETRQLIPEDLEKHCSETLPEYMIPPHFIRLEKFPLSPGGKINRSALPDPETTRTGLAAAPRNRVEKTLAEIWTDVLNLNKSPGIDENFFKLGGHSLKATQLTARIHKELNVQIPLAQLFQTPDIRRQAEYIKNAVENIYSSIAPVELKEYYPLSSAQKRMYVLNRFKGNETSDNTPMIMKVEGPLDTRRFQSAIKKVIQRHEILRTSFNQLEDETPVQTVYPQVEIDIPLTEVTPEEIDDAVYRFVRPFDLSRAPLLRVGLLRLSQEHHLIMCDMHHIIADGTARTIFITDFITLYEQDVDTTPMPELRVHYKDFSIWQNELMKSRRLKEQEEYWIRRYHDVKETPPMRMPTDFPRPEIQVFDGKSVSFQLSREHTEKIEDMLRRRGLTLYMFLLTTYNVLLSRWSGQDDIIVGTPIAGRPHADLEHIIGMFANTLAMRNKPEGNKTFTQFLEEVKENALDAYDNQDYQFEQLVNRLGIEPDPGRHPLFDTMFVVQNIDMNRKDYKKEIKNLKFTAYPFEENITQFDIITHAFQLKDEGTVGFKIRYSIKLFKSETMDRFIEFFKEIIETVVENPDIKLNEIKLSHGLIDQKLNVFDQNEDFEF